MLLHILSAWHCQIEDLKWVPKNFHGIAYFEVFFRKDTIIAILPSHLYDTPAMEDPTKGVCSVGEQRCPRHVRMPSVDSSADCGLRAATGPQGQLKSEHWVC